MNDYTIYARWETPKCIANMDKATLVGVRAPSKENPMLLEDTEIAHLFPGHLNDEQVMGIRYLMKQMYEFGVRSAQKNIRQSLGIEGDTP